MKLFVILVAVETIGTCSVAKIIVEGDNEALTNAAVNIVDTCLGVIERWTELLISGEPSDNMMKMINHESRASNLIITPVQTNDDNEFTCRKKCKDTLTSTAAWKDSKTTVVVIVVRDLQHLESVLHFVKYDNPKLWRPRLQFVVMLETKCDVEESNKMLKVLWKYWILNVVILCSSNESEVDLYTFNPYSMDHSPAWETVVEETVEVSIVPANFNHTWRVFKRTFEARKNLTESSDLYFDKTANLDGSVIPVSVFIVRPQMLLDTRKSGMEKWLGPDGLVLQTLAKKLRFDVAEVFTTDKDDPYGQALKNGSYSGILGDLFHGRSNLAVFARYMVPSPGLEMTYPHMTSGVCFASRIVGLRPQWTNIFVAKYIWIVFAVFGIIFTVVLYLQNKSQGILSAFLDAERLLVGSSVINSPKLLEYRFLLGSIFLAIVVVDGIFRGRLISLLAIARPYPNFDTLEQVKEQGVGVAGYWPFRGLVDDPDLKAGYRKLLVSDCLGTLERGEQRACLAECLTLPALITNSTKIHTASSTIMVYFVVYMATMDWPLKDRWEFEVQKIAEGGIVNKWLLDLYRDLEVNSWKLKRATEPPYVKPIELNDMLPAFLILFVGLPIALCFFLREMRCRPIQK